MCSLLSADHSGRPSAAAFHSDGYYALHSASPEPETDHAEILHGGVGVVLNAQLRHGVNTVQGIASHAHTRQPGADVQVLACRKPTPMQEYAIPNTHRLCGVQERASPAPTYRFLLIST